MQSRWLASTALLFIATVWPALAQDASYAPRPIEASAAQADIRLLRRSLVEVHPGFDRYASATAMQEMLDELERRVGLSGTTDMALYREISLILARIRCDHTKAEVPKAFEEFRKNRPTCLPFTFRLIGGRMFVAAAESGSPLNRGDEVLSINGRTVGSIQSDVAALLSVDGWTDHVKSTELENGGGELLASGIDHFWPFLYGWPDRWTVEAREGRDGPPRKLEVAPITLGQWKSLAAIAFPGAANFKDAIAFQMLDEHTGLLRIDTFVNYRQPVDALAALSPAFEELNRRAADHLILDLRRCGGGSDDAAVALMTLLMKAPPAPPLQSWVRTYRVGDLRPHLKTWDDSVFELPDDLFRKLDNGYFEMRTAAAPASRPAHPLTFEGRLSILIGPANQSGATIVVSQLRAQRPQTRLIGEATGGSVEGPTAGVIFFVKLPASEITVRVPGLRSRLGLPFVPGMGIRPDLEVGCTYDDWLAGRDEALEAAKR